MVTPDLSCQIGILINGTGASEWFDSHFKPPIKSGRRHRARLVGDVICEQNDKFGAASK